MPRARVATAASLAPWVVLAIAVVLGGGAAWLLGQSPFPPGGLGGDQSFRIAAIARDARQVFPVDFAYHGLPVFYPPTFFFVLGRLVAITGIPAYEALKFGVIAVAFLVPVIGYGLWRRLTGDAVIAAAVVVAGVALHDWYEPYSWIALVAFVPWWFAFVVQPIELVRGATRTRVVVGSLVGGLIVTTYYYFFLIGAVQLVALLGATWVARRRNRALPLRVTRRVVARARGHRARQRALLGAAGLHDGRHGQRRVAPESVFHPDDDPGARALPAARRAGRGHAVRADGAARRVPPVLVDARADDIARRRLRVVRARLRGGARRLAGPRVPHRGADPGRARRGRGHRGRARCPGADRFGMVGAAAGSAADAPGDAARDGRGRPDRVVARRDPVSPRTTQQRASRPDSSASSTMRWRVGSTARSCSPPILR